MAKRKMPAHIVLPNGMWRFVKGKSRASAKVRRARVARKRTRGVQMARYRKRARSSSKGMMGGIVHKGSLTSGLVRPSGILQQAILGAGAATLAENSGLSNFSPYAKYVAGGAVGGIGGVAGVFLRDMLKGGKVGTSVSYGNY